MKLPSITFVCALLLFPALLPADTLTVTSWLTTGPLAAPEPLFIDSAARGEADRYLQTDTDYREWQPAAGGTVDWLPGESARWESRTGGTVSWQPAAAPSVALAAAYINAARWQETTFAIRSSRPVAVWLNGKFIARQTAEKDGVFELKPEFTLHRGQHLLLVNSVNLQTHSGAWTVTAAAAPDSIMRGSLSIDTDPHRPPAEFREWANFHEFSTPIVSRDGKFAAVVRSRRNADHRREAWLEIHDAKAGGLLHTIRPGRDVSRPFFFPKSRRIGFVINSDDGATVWTYDLATREQRPIAEKLKNLNRLELSPDERFIYYSADAEASEAVQKANYTRFDALEDKVVDWSNRKQLYVLSVESGARHLLTEIGENAALERFALSAEGDKLAFLRFVPKPGRPYYHSQLWVYDVRTKRAENVLTVSMTEPPSTITWLPGGTQIAYAAAGYESTAEDTVFPNVNHHVLYLLDLRTKQVKNLSAGETFSVAEEGSTSRIYWHPRDRQLYVLGVTGGQTRIYRTGLDGGRFTTVRAGRPLIDAFQLSEDGSTLVMTASSPAEPFAFMALDPKTGRGRTLLDPNAAVVRQYELATMEDFDFVNSAGDRIEGWLHFPPDFDPNRKWPTLIYYYGGVSPRDERFTFTYHWWAANGYVVYVLNPVGSVGYGQAFADKHSNDWGTLATQDVIEGTRKLLAAKPYVDAKRLGAYGGSYGGFITLDLLTKTDMFAAAVDMYGISNIASYFGGGTWGHLYGDLALPGSYPWSHRDVFIEKSPLFRADRIDTPLLILHGGADNNVPPSESEQMFVALKILGREDVEYVRFKDESHNINTKFENLIEHREMMLEWFDKYLKDQPEAWNKRWEAER